MTDPLDELAKGLGAIVSAETDNFVALAKLVGLDPTTDYVGADLSGADFSDCDLAGFNFSGAILTGITLNEATSWAGCKLTGARVDRRLIDQMKGAYFD